MTRPFLESYLVQLRRGLAWCEQQPMAMPPRQIRNVVLVGTGDEATAAEIVAGWAVRESAVPVSVWQSSRLPAFVGPHTLVIAVSFSGDDVETNEAAKEAVQRGAMLACVTGGGFLLNFAQNATSASGGNPVLAVAEVPGLGHFPLPPIAYLLIQLCALLQRFGVLSQNMTAEWQQAVALFDKREYFIQDGAENLALGLGRKLPVVYADAAFGAVLRRFQQQLSRQCQQLAHVNVFPEPGRAELSAWRHPEDTLTHTTVVLLTTPADSPETTQCMETVRQKVVPASGGVAEVRLTHGTTLLDLSLYAVCLFDWAAFFLARDNENRPPVGSFPFFRRD